LASLLKNAKRILSAEDRIEGVRKRQYRRPYQKSSKLGKDLPECSKKTNPLGSPAIKPSGFLTRYIQGWYRVQLFFTTDIFKGQVGLRIFFLPSHVNQQLDIKSFVKMKGWKLKKIFRDEGFSGQRTDRGNY